MPAINSFAPGAKKREGPRARPPAISESSPGASRPAALRSARNRRGSRRRLRVRRRLVEQTQAELDAVICRQGITDQRGQKDSLLAQALNHLRLHRFALAPLPRQFAAARQMLV
jgi:hypothetical protein